MTQSAIKGGKIDESKKKKKQKQKSKQNKKIEQKTQIVENIKPKLARIGIPLGEVRKKETELLLNKITAEKFLNVMGNTNQQI